MEEIEEVVKELSFRERVVLRIFKKVFKKIYKEGVKRGFNWNN